MPDVATCLGSSRTRCFFWSAQNPCFTIMARPMTEVPPDWTTHRYHTCGVSLDDGVFKSHSIHNVDKAKYMSHRGLRHAFLAAGLGAARCFTCSANFLGLRRCGSSWCVSCLVLSVRLVGVLCSSGRRLTSFHWSCDSFRS